MPKIIYLTIDDAPSSDCINKLDYLDQHGIRAVWFAEGRRIEEYPAYALEILKRGHILANHAWTHPFFSAISLEQACDEIARTDALLNQLYAQANIERQHRFFRFPYGDKGGGLFSDLEGTRSAEGQAHYSAIQSYLRDLGYTQPTFADITYKHYHEAGLLNDVDWYWTYDTHDWCPYSDHPAHGIDSVEKVLARLDEDVPDGGHGINDPDSADIVLIHDLVNADSLFVQLLDKLIAKGVIFRLP